MKGPEAFRSISEAAAELGVPSHVLRFWETKFSFIRPMKRAGGRRFYRRQDIDMLRGVRTLLHEEGYTIKGVQRLHKEGGVRRLAAVSAGETTAAAPFMQDDGALRASSAAPAGRAVLNPAAQARLRTVLSDLEAVKKRLDALLSTTGPAQIPDC